MVPLMRKKGSRCHLVFGDREPMSFGVRRSRGDVIWCSTIGLIFIAGQVETLLDWEIRTYLASGFWPSSIATSPPMHWSSSALGAGDCLKFNKKKKLKVSREPKDLWMRESDPPWVPFIGESDPPSVMAWFRSMRSLNRILGLNLTWAHNLLV